jgi:hypothetical protein
MLLAHVTCWQSSVPPCPVLLQSYHSANVI